MANDPDEGDENDWLSSDPTDGGFDPASFSGVARLFPLPGPSLYPQVVQPLHVFEERYRELMRDALDSDGLIAMAVLRPGWETDYASRPPLEPVACLGKIVAHHRLDDGRYNLLLAGVARVKILEELDPPLAFRRARVEVLGEQDPKSGDLRADALTRRLCDAFRAALPGDEVPTPLQKVLAGDAPLGLLADLAAYTLPLGREVKQAVLAEPVAVARAALVIQALDVDADDDGPDPGSGPVGGGFSAPPFSEN